MTTQSFRSLIDDLKAPRALAEDVDAVELEKEIEVCDSIPQQGPLLILAQNVLKRSRCASPGVTSAAKRARLHGGSGSQEDPFDIDADEGETGIKSSNKNNDVVGVFAKRGDQVTDCVSRSARCSAGMNPCTGS